MTKKCAKCGGEIPEQEIGRPKIYCSTGCRRAAEFEIRRINSTLGKLEEKLTNARLGYGCDPEKTVKLLQSEIVRHEARLVALLEEN